MLDAVRVRGGEDRKVRPLHLTRELSFVPLSESHAFCQSHEPPGPLRGLCGCSAWNPEGGDVSSRELGGEKVSSLSL